MSDRTPRQDKTTPRDDAFYAQCLRYIDGDLNDEQFAAFQDQLDSDERLRKQYVELNVLCEWIAEASDAEHANDALTMAELYTRSRLAPGPASTQPSAREVFSFMGDLAMQALRTRAGIIGSVAALLLLGAALYLSFIGLGTEPSTQEIADHTADETNDPIEPTASTESTPRGSAVATLTAEHNAQWTGGPASAGLSNGDTLTAGTRLTLTAGFAEITTHDGAVAILEAPATVELIDSNNALRLHTGKLVGSCYSESSKGFVVKTEHADITDIGTEFGVQVQGNRVTATVITGEIEMDVPGSAPQRLMQDQTAQLRVNGVNRKLQIKDQLAQGFEALLPRRRLADALRNDPAMIAYYGFEAEDIVDGKLLNRAVATQGKMDGTLGQTGKPDSSPTLTEGRLPGTGALRFEAQEFDLVRVSVEDARAVDGLEALTIAAWVKPDRMDQASHHLVTKRVGDKCVLNLAMVWDSDRGADPNSLLFNSDLAGLTYKEHATEKDTLVRSGAWTHIAVTFDQGERRYYVNGELIGTRPRVGADKTLTLDAELAIGAQYANARAAATNLDGDLDELFILGRVMPHDEITTLYETGVAQP